jgi:prepilin-type N-terminal cleavage/methylation domain-containing protein
MRRNNGFTLTELLISMAVLGILSVYLTNMLTQQSRAYTVVDQVTEAQGSGRAILDLLERELRGTAGLTPEAAAVCGVDNTNRADVLFVTDGDAYEFDGDDPAFKYYDAAAKIDSGLSAAGPGDVLRVASMAPDGQAFYDLDSDGTADSDFRPGGAVIVMDINNPSRGTACGVIVAGGVDVAGKQLTVDFTNGAENPGLASLPLTAWVVPAHRYTVNAQNQLMRDDLRLADDVEDLQLAYFFDSVTADNEVDSNALEYPGTVDGNVYDATDWDNSELREIRFSFVVRSRMTDPNLPGAVPQPLENHAPAAVPDGFRRRVLTATVRPRNVGHRLEVEF